MMRLFGDRPLAVEMLEAGAEGGAQHRGHCVGAITRGRDPKDLVSMRQRAIALVCEAIAMLDEAGQEHAALHLQTAIDAAERKAPLKPGKEILDENLAAPLRRDSALVRAMSGALALIASVMTRQGGVSLHEVADLLGMYAGVTNKSSPTMPILRPASASSCRSRRCTPSGRSSLGQSLGFRRSVCQN